MRSVRNSGFLLLQEYKFVAYSAACNTLSSLRFRPVTQPIKRGTGPWRSIHAA